MSSDRSEPRPGPFAPSADHRPRGDARLWSFAGYLVGRRRLAEALSVPADLKDAALVAAALATWGVEASLDRLEGPCSWIAWEPSRRRLHAVVDRLGLCPLYWSRNGSTLSLARRAASLASLRSPQDVEAVAVAAHLHGAAVPAGATFSRHVRSVPAGSCLRAGADGVSVRRYWRPEQGPAPRNDDLDGAADSLLDLLETVVGEHAAGPAAGVTLSAGRDSTAVAAAWRRSMPGAERLQAILWSLNVESVDDESSDAARVARHLDFVPSILPVADAGPLAHGGEARSTPDRPTPLGYVEAWEETFRHAGDLGLRALLTGAGGDQVFGAGEYFAYADLLTRGRWLAAARRWRIHRAEAAPGTAGWWRWWLRPLLVSVLPRGWARFRPSPWAVPELRRLAAEVAVPSSRWWLPGPAARSRREALNPVLLSPPLIDLAERGAAHGVECRHPLLDHRLVEWAAAAGSETVLWRGRAKGLLRSALERDLPPQGEVPLRKPRLDLWWRHALTQRPTAFAALLEGSLGVELGLLDADAVRDSAEALREARADQSVWPVLTLESWLRRHLGAPQRR